MRMIRRFEAVILTSVMLALPVLGAVALHRLSAFGWLTIDWSDPLPWIARTPPEDIVAAILRHVGLAGCYWLSTASVVYTAGRLAGLPRIVSALGPVTPRIVRSVADRVVIGAVTLSSLGVSPAPAMADHHQPPLIDPIEIRATIGAADVDPPAVALVHDDYLPHEIRSPIRDVPDTQHESSGAPAENPGTVASVRNNYLPHDPPSPIPSARDTRHQETVEVQSGDSLWLISSQHLRMCLGRPPTADELRAHWQATIETNLPTLRSGNPNLIHPGEIITLPPTPEG